MTTPADRLVMQWEEAGARVASSVAGSCAVLVTGRDPVAAAHAALGIGRVESERRRVAIGDLVGDVAPLVALVADDDPHGLVDSFLYGVSLNKVAHPASGFDNLYILPSGTEPVLTEEIYRSDRWRRLASGFREVGALLLLVAPADAPGLDALVEMLDGVITVGDEHGDLKARFPVIAAVEGWRAERPRRGDTPIEAEVPMSAGRGGRHRTPSGDVLLPAAREARPAPARRSPLVPLLVLLVALAGGGGAAWWWRTQRAAPATAPAPADTARPAATPPAPADTLPAQTFTVLNPGDSATAAAFGILVKLFNTEEGARLAVQQAPRLPVATWFPVRLNDPSVWYRVVGGAWGTQREADSALAALRIARVVDTLTATVRTPLALLVGGRLGPDSLRARRARYEAASIPVYALVQEDGTSNLYAGAFETPDQSMFLALALQQLGDVPTLVYRTGRAP